MAWHNGSRFWRLLALLLGVALFIAAGLSLLRIDLSALTRGSPWLLAGIALAVLGNVVLTAVLFWVITLSLDTKPPVGLVRMTDLIAWSSLLNYLPLRPGLLGRAAFLKIRHQLPLRQSAWTLAVVVVVGGVVMAAAAAPALLQLRGLSQGLTTAVSAGLLLLFSAAAGPLARWALGRPMVAAWSWLLIRTVDLLVNGLRLYWAFQMVGGDLSFGAAVLAGAVANLVSVLGITPNGLGLREWALAALGPLLLTRPDAAATAAAAAVVDRGVESVVLCLAGLISWRRLGPLGAAPAAAQAAKPADDAGLLPPGDVR